MDGFPEIEVKKNALWGKQTQRSLKNFNIGNQQFDKRFIDALVMIKHACAQVNCQHKLLTKEQCDAIMSSCDEILNGEHANQFPLSIWQTGSGTQTNMNVNEVICSLARTRIAESKRSTQSSQKKKVDIHPNDHINLSQSSNDVFPSAMHIVVAQQTQQALLPTIDLLINELFLKQIEFEKFHTVSRTHLMDALPVNAGALLFAYRDQLAAAKCAIHQSLDAVYQLAIGATAIGSGANAPQCFGPQVVALLAEYFQLPFKPNPNLYAAVSGEDALLRYSGALKQLASVLFKVANDVRLLGSGPRCGFNEWHLPANESGSSIMPGKVNPTQCEAMSMVCLQVFGNDLTVSLAAANGQLQLNTNRPVIIYNLLESIELLSDAMHSFTENCVCDLTINRTQIETNMRSNLSAITLLTNYLGYDVSAAIARKAELENMSLAEASEALGFYSQAEFNNLLNEQLKGYTGSP
ncbi:class II fumarate hydratase [Alteromonadaceae bacterium M269]|nr:class II fumarate hydratase [Alteromonadaceae bacterium M269]